MRRRGVQARREKLELLVDREDYPVGEVELGNLKQLRERIFRTRCARVIPVWPATARRPRIPPPGRTLGRPTPSPPSSAHAARAVLAAVLRQHAEELTTLAGTLEEAELEEERG